MSRKNREKAKYQQEEEQINLGPAIVKPITKNQSLLVDTINKNLITFAIGPAGCGKTHISMGCAIEHVYNNWVKKIIITRPIVEVGASMGYLPGSLEEKISPYLVPLFDEMKTFWPENSNYQPPIDIIPLNFMRGRTVKDSFIILDEAQNCTEEQLKMFITRYGKGSKIVITGDLSQSDLPAVKRGALEKYVSRLEGIEMLGIVKLDNTDIVRHELIAKILDRLNAI